MVQYSRATWVACSPMAAFRPIQRIGGTTGWYYGNWLWRLRGLLDSMVGGVGYGRGRKHPDRLAVGDFIDFWRVERFDPNRLLGLRAEMRLPGRARAEFEVREERGGSTVRFSAFFDPDGWFGHAYWYALLPIHVLVFRGMLKGIVREMGRCEEGA